LDKNARQGWEYSFPDPRACVHPQLHGLAVSRHLYFHQLYELMVPSSHMS
jgi:hypothetical protein